ncbi:MAG: hydroxyacid dehydrogenase [Gallionellaceae bacterium CG11_big_fil_rev_8_21_14_0_20_60_62]|nr:MAG: hydroxyacid dehydrogenase [Gallionellaceae bacterium CG11_big_fil_rev_8_21_14_0_20_60_62]PIV48212.1 MAG: hydroxyacid dehydrogenase [Gallionellaceae bacterium CG02_land_8_20_14_3_00_60_115]
MKVAVCSTQPYDRESLQAANAAFGQQLVFFEERLSTKTIALFAGYPVLCAFVNDRLDAEVLQALSDQGLRLVALRCAGFNNVDIEATQRLGICVARVPAYSPHSVAEHTLALMLALNRKTHRAYNRIRDGNFSLHGLLGFELSGRTVGIIGTGRIGQAVAEILRGFGCNLLAYDIAQNPACSALGVNYVGLDALYRDSDIITLHCPLNQQTRHLIDAAALARMRRGVMLLNTSRGAVVDTAAVIGALKSGQVGYLGMDVYEQEGDLFFRNLSEQVIQDDIFERLLTFPNVLITGHQGFFTTEALASIAATTLENIRNFEQGGQCQNEVTRALLR